MIPLRDVIPSRTFPAVTVGLIAVSTAVFLLQQSISAAESLTLARLFGLTPGSLEWWTPVTATFFHPGWLSFVANMLTLWLFGDNLEDRSGRARYLAFYLTCGALASLAQAWASPASGRPALGASGAVAGVLGGYFVMYPRSRILAWAPVPGVGPVIELPAVAFLVSWLFAQLVISVPLLPGPAVETESFSFTACAAGFLGGALLIPVFRRAERLRVEWWHDPPTSETGSRVTRGPARS
jgi:membrane associated rhomboid family serine protease